MTAIAAAMVVGSIVPSFAGSDGWTDLVFHAWRNPSTLAIAAVSGRSGNTSGYAGIALTKLVGTDTMYFDNYRGGTNSDYISNNKK